MGIGTQTQGTSGQTKTYEPLSPGNYVLELDSVTPRESKKGSKYYEVTFKVAEGEHKNRLIFNTRYFYDGVSPKAIDISNEQANKLLKAMGINGGLSDIGDDLGALNDHLGKSFVGRVDVEYPEGYKARNIVKAYRRR